MKKVLTVFLTAIYLLSVVCTAAAMPSLDTADTLDDLGLVETEFASDFTQDIETEEEDVIEADDVLAQESEIDDYDAVVQEEISGEVIYHKDFESADSTIDTVTYGKDFETGGKTAPTKSIEEVTVINKNNDAGSEEETKVLDLKFAKANDTSRMKLINVFNESSLTPYDVGSKYRVTMNVYNASDDFQIRLELASGRKFNYGSYDRAVDNPSYNTYACMTNFSDASSNINLPSGKWTPITYEVTLKSVLRDQLVINNANAQGRTGTAEIYIDDIKCEKLEGPSAKEDDDLQNIFDTTAAKLSGVTLEGGKYVLGNGSSIKYGSKYIPASVTATTPPSKNTVTSRFHAEKNTFYAINMKAKIPDGKLEIRANSVTVDRVNTPSDKKEYNILFRDDFTLKQGEQNVLVISGSKSGTPAQGATMPSTGDEFDDITIIYNDTGIKDERKYYGKDQDILRALDIYSTGDGNVIESFNVSKIDDINSFIENLYFPGNFSKWTEQNGFTVSDSEIVAEASSEENELSYNFKAFEGKAVVLNYNAKLNSAPASGAKLPYIGIYDNNDKLIGVSLINSTSAKSGKIIANIPVETAEENLTSLKIKIVSGSVAATISDISLDGYANLYEITKTPNESEPILNVSVDFSDIDVPQNFKIAVMKPGKGILDLIDNSNVLSSVESSTSAINANLDLSEIETYSETLNIIIYNEENSVYITDTYNYVNAGFVENLLRSISSATSKNAMITIIETYDENSDTYYNDILGLTDISYYNDASPDDLEFIYQYIYNCKNEIVNPSDNKDLTNLHKIVYKAALVLTLKSSDSTADFKGFMNDSDDYLDYSYYDALRDIDTYSDSYFSTNVLSPVCTMINTGIISTFEDVMNAVCDLMVENPGDNLSKFTMRCNFEDGADLENTIEYGGESNASSGVSKASALGIVDHTKGTGDGSVLVFSRDENGKTGRMKIANAFNPNGLTPRDLGSTFRVTFWTYNPNGRDLTVKVGLMSVKYFNASGGIDNSKSSKYATSFQQSNSFVAPQNVWTKVSLDFTITSLLPGSLGFDVPNSKGLYFDDLSIERITDNRPVINENDLQPMTNTSAISLSGVTKTSEGYVFTQDGTFSYGMGTNALRKMRYVAEPNEYYQISMVAKTTANGLTLTANSVNVNKAGTATTATDFVVEDQDDFNLVAGNSNGVIISCDGKIAPDGATMIDTNGEFKTINITFKDTGISNEIKYLDRSLDILRSINITGNASDNIVKSITVKKVTSPLGEVSNGTFDSLIEFDSWGESSADRDAFGYADGKLTVNGSDANDGKSLSQVIILDKNAFYQLGFTASNASGDSVIQIVDNEGKIIGVTKIAPVSEENAEKSVVFKTGDSSSDSVPVAIKIVAGKEGTAKIDNVRILTADDAAYKDLTKYTPLTIQYSSAGNDFRTEIINKTMSVDSNNSEEMLKVMCDNIIDYTIELAEKKNDVIYKIIDDNNVYLNLTNWSKAEAFKGTLNYNTVKANIVNYVLNYGYKTLNAKIPSLLPEKETSSGPSGGGNGNKVSIPSTITSTTTPKPDSNNNNNNITFNDLHLAQWAEESILSLAKKGVISGYEDGSFKPNNSITRAEFAKLLVMAFGVEDKTAVSSFNDVSSFDWYYSYVATLEKLGVAKGMGNGAYGAYDQISRQDMVVLIVRMAELLDKPINATTSETTFTDNDDIAAYALEAVKILQRAEIVSGLENNAFGPNQTATRAQVAKILNALIG